REGDRGALAAEHVEDAVAGRLVDGQQVGPRPLDGHRPEDVQVAGLVVVLVGPGQGQVDGAGQPRREADGVRLRGGVGRVNRLAQAHQPVHGAGDVLERVYGEDGRHRPILEPFHAQASLLGATRVGAYILLRPGSAGRTYQPEWRGHRRDPR